MQRIYKTKRGFTLVEMLLVIAIIVILASVVAINVGSYITRSQRAKNEKSEEVSTLKSGISVQESFLGSYGFGGY